MHSKRRTREKSNLAYSHFSHKSGHTLTTIDGKLRQETTKRREGEQYDQRRKHIHSILLPGLGKLPAASHQSHCTPDSRATRPTSRAPPSLHWHDRHSYDWSACAV